MQKKLIALAVAGMMAAPLVMAQSNVTVYGRAELGVLNLDTANGKSEMHLRQGALGGSRIGFRGTEDLGNGLKVGFLMEYGTAIDAAPGPLTSRYSNLSLSGGFGTLVAGRLASPGDMVVGGFRAYSGVWDSTPRTNSMSVTLTNAIAYVTPNFNGFQAVIGHALDEDNTVSSDITGLNMTYKNGPIGLAYAMHYLRNDGAKNTQDHFIGGSYDFGMLRAFASWETRRGLNTAAGFRDKVWNIGAVIPVSDAGSVQVAYGSRDANIGAQDASNFVLGYTHKLSNRTSLTAAWREFDPKNLDNRSNYGVTMVHTF